MRNIAAYLGVYNDRRNTLLIPGGIDGSDLLNNGLYVALNKVPTDDGSWATAPYEAQYLKLYDVTAPSTTPGVATGPNAYGYVIGSSVTFTWTAAPADGEGVTPTYKIAVTINGNTTYYYNANTTLTISAAVGQILSITVQSVNPNDQSVTGATSAASQIKVLDTNGDEDGDGMSNGNEDQYAGTNPLDPNSILRVSSITRPDATQVSVTWKSVAGKTYQLQTASAPGPSENYSNIGSPQVATGPSTNYSVAGSAPAFYRVRVLP